jgi:hypothetical protein
MVKTFPDTVTVKMPIRRFITFRLKNPKKTIKFINLFYVLKALNEWNAPGQTPP